MYLLLFALTDYLGAIFLAIVILALGVFLYYVPVNKYRKCSKMLQNKGDISYEDFVAKDKIFSSLYKEYIRDFLPNTELKTKFQAEQYFNYESFLWSLGINPKKISSASSALSGMGVLGTFVGLTYSVCVFKTDTPEAMQDSISTLLSGMGAAFLTSIAGMLASIIFTLYEKSEKNKLEKELVKLCEELNRKHLLAPEDIIRNEIIKHLTYVDENNNHIYLSSAVRDIKREMIDQTECLNTLVDDSDAGLTAQIGKMLAPKLDNLAEKLDAIKNPTENLSEDISNQIRGALENMIKNLGQNLNDSAMNQINSLADRLNSTSEVLVELPQSMASMMSNVQTSFGGMSATIEEMKNSMNSVIEATANSSKSLIKQSQEQNSKLVQNVHESNKTTVEAAAAFASAIEKQKDITTQITSSLSQFQTVKEGFGALVLQVKGLTENMSLASAQLKNAQEKYLNGMESIQRDNSHAISDLKDILDRTKTALKEYSDQFDTIKSGLSGVFKEINTGLSSYSTTVGSETQRVLTGYSQAVEKGIKDLMSAISSLDAIATSLTDSVEELNKKK